MGFSDPVAGNQVRQWSSVFEIVPERAGRDHDALGMPVVPEVKMI